MERLVEVDAYAGAGVTLEPGETLRIIDVEGQQVADLFAVSADDLTEWLSTAHTRAATGRLFPKVGESFFSNRYRPMLRFVADQSPGAHDMLWPACSQDLYNVRGHQGYHRSCAENFLKNAAQFGWVPGEVPDPVDFFQNTPVNEHHEIGHGPGPTKAGDSVLLLAEMRLRVVVTACSWDLPGTAFNGDRCTGLRLEIGKA